MVIKILNQNTEIAQKAILKLVELLPEKTECDCNNALSNAILTQKTSISPNALKKLDLFINKYII